MQVFKITKNLEAVCRSEGTRYGFRHLAELQRDGYREIAHTKACYYNRTWERYQFESVLESLLENSQELLTGYELRTFKNKLKNQWRKDDEKKTSKMFSTVAMVAKMGEVLTGSQKEANDWKARILKAGLGDRGLTMPEDWDQLSEDEKTARLDGVLSVIKK